MFSQSPVMSSRVPAHWRSSTPSTASRRGVRALCVIETGNAHDPRPAPTPPQQGRTLACVIGGTLLGSRPSRQLPQAAAAMRDAQGRRLGPYEPRRSGVTPETSLRSQRRERSPRIADYLVGMGHPVLKVAEVNCPALDLRQRALGKRQSWLCLFRLDQRWTPTSTSGLRPARRCDLVAQRRQACPTRTAAASSGALPRRRSMPSPAASVVADASGAAARMSTAAAARDVLRRPAAAARRASNQLRSRSQSSCRPSAASSARASRRVDR